MFGNSKEYQDLQKLYAEKVSKPENIDERLRGGGIIKKINPFKRKKELSEPDFDDPNRNIGRGGSKDELNKLADTEKKRAAELEKKELSEPDFDDPNRNIGRGGSKDELNKLADTEKKRKEEEAKKKAEANKKKAEENKKEVEFRLKNTESSEQSAKVEKPEPTYKSRVTGADRAKALAKARIKSGKTVADVKASNTQSMKDAARARNDAFKAKRAERNLDKQRDFDDPAKGNFGLSNDRGKSVKKLGKPQPKVKSPMDMRGESYEPYDIVLEYLLSSQQAATIEEANYIMTEMDAKTIQDIVSQQLNEQN